MRTLEFILILSACALWTCKPGATAKPEIKEYDLIKWSGSDVQTVIQYDSAGNKRIEGNIMGGKKNGAWITYNSAGQIIDITNYIDDQKQGPYLRLNGGNSLTEQGSYHKNLLHGTVIKYLHGHVDEKIEFKNGIRDGWARKYYLGGGIQREMQLYDSIKIGIYRFYGENGVLQIEEVYKNDQKISGGILNN
jgi:antitoxin component YwqK of YwqJK toxin-antitoxin module